MPACRQAGQKFSITWKDKPTGGGHGFENRSEYKVSWGFDSLSFRKEEDQEPCGDLFFRLLEELARVPGYGPSGEYGFPTLRNERLFSASKFLCHVSSPVLTTGRRFSVGC